MRIFLAHNYYQIPGGEDEIFRRERDLLIAAGHQVTEYVRDNHEIATYKPVREASLAVRTTWAWDTYKTIGKLLQRTKPEVAHFRNTFPLISPAAYYACKKAGVPVVQSLDNPRLMCPGATFYRGNRFCDKCLQAILPWPAILHRCYRHSSSQTCAVVAMVTFHRLLRTWGKLVDRYVVSTEFYRRKFIQAGLPADKIALRPHFVDDPGVIQANGSYALFIGRLSAEKGVLTLLRAWERIEHIPLKIRGDGPLTLDVQKSAERFRNVELLPRLSREELNHLLHGARFLVWPSEGHYETFGCVAAEAFACGVPVIASEAGAMEEMVSDRRTGLIFRPGDASHLAERVNWAWNHPAEMKCMGREARSEYERKYTVDRAYRTLIGIYESVMHNGHARENWAPSAQPFPDSLQD